MYEQIAQMFDTPEAQQAIKARFMQMLQSPDAGAQKQRAIADALGAAGRTLSSTPGNFLTGLSAAAADGSDTYRAGTRPPDGDDKGFQKIMDLLDNTGKASDLAQYREGQLANREAETARRSEADRQRSDLTGQRIDLLKDRLGILETQGNRKLDQGDRRVDQGDRRIDVTEAQGSRRLDQGDRCVDVTDQQGNRRLDQADTRENNTAAYRDKTLAISQQNADTAAKNATRIRQGAKADPRKLEIEAHKHLLQARKEIFANIDEYATPEDKAAAEEMYSAYEQEFRKKVGAAAPQGSGDPLGLSGNAGADPLGIR